MEKVLQQILNRLDTLASEIREMKPKVEQIDDIKVKVEQIDDIKLKVEQIDDIKVKVEQIDNLKAMVEEVFSLKPKIEESHQWLGALYKAGEFHKADIDQLNHKVAKLEGSLKGSAKQLLNDLDELKDVSNQ